MRTGRFALVFVLLVPMTAFAFSESITFSPQTAQPGQSVVATISGLSKTGTVRVDGVTFDGTTITIDATSTGGICGPACLYQAQAVFNAPPQPGTYNVEYWLTFAGQRALAGVAKLVVANICDFGHSLTADKTAVRIGGLGVTLSWCNPGYGGTDFGYFVRFYRVYGAHTSDGPFTPLYDIQSAGAATAFVQPPVAGTTYYYVESHGCQGVVTNCGFGALDTTITTNIVAVTAAAPGTCLPDPITLCVLQNRFAVTARWQATDGRKGDGMAVPMIDAGGYFWFFNAGNVEVTAKVLDACSLKSPAFWFFASGMTNVSVDLTVTDTRTNAVKHYTNPLGTPFTPILDTSAFPCP